MNEKEYLTIVQFDEYKNAMKELNELRDKRMDEKFNDLKKFLDEKFSRVFDENAAHKVISDNHEKRLQSVENALENKNIKKGLLIAIGSSVVSACAFIAASVNFILENFVKN